MDLHKSNSYPDLLSADVRMLLPPTFGDKFSSFLNSKTAIQQRPISEEGQVVPGDGMGSSERPKSPRAGKTTKEIPYNLFDRVIQFVADGLNIGSAYKLYCLSSNLELLCKKPEEWGKNPAKAKVLEYLLQECKDKSDFQSVLENILAPISESLLSRGFAIAEKMQKTCCAENFDGVGKLLAAFADQGLEKAAKRIVGFYEPNEVNNELNSLRMDDMLLTFMTDCPDIDSQKIENALARQFELVLVKSPKSTVSQKPAYIPVARFSAFCLEKTFQTRSNIPNAVSEDTGSELKIEKGPGLQSNTKLENLATARKLLDSAKNTANINIKRSHKSLIGSERTDLLKSDKDFLSKKGLKKELNTCFADYYESISAARFESREAEKVIRKLYNTLAALEENKLNPLNFPYFLREIGGHVENNAVGREGGLLGKVLSENSSFKKESGDVKKFSEFLSVTSVFDFSEESMKAFKGRQKEKLELSLGSQAFVAGSGKAKIIL